MSEPPRETKPLDTQATAPTDATTRDVPAGFRALSSVGEFIVVNGPLFVRRDGDILQFGFRVEKRHTNPLGICHGGMMASFCDMLLPLSIHRKSPEVGMRFLPTVNLQLDYLAPAPVGAWVQGEAEVLRVTRSLVFAQGLVKADDTPCARVSGIFKIGPPFQRSVDPAG